MPGMWKDEPWFNSPEVLLASLEALYRRALAIGKIQSVLETTNKKIMANRGYAPAVPREALSQAIEDLQIVYIPESIPPGPGFLFPIRDVTGEIRRLHIRLLDGATGGLRYLSIVDKHLFTGPPWLGNDEETLERIINRKTVLVVEGPFDLLAVKALAPEFPALCPLTKRLGKLHKTYLEILGVRRIITLWDDDAAGRKASSRDLNGFQTLALRPPGAKDPSDALLNYNSMCDLQDLIRSIPPVGEQDED